MTEGAFDVEWRRLLLSFQVGYGRVVSGELTHASANSYYLESHSDLTGDRWAIQLAGGYRLVDYRAFALDLLAGAEYRRDHFAAWGATGTVLGTLSRDDDGIPKNERAAEETTTWVSPFVALRLRWSPIDRLTVRGVAQGSPWQWVEFRERRPHRADLQQPVSTEGETTGGWGIQGSLVLAYRLTGWLSMTAGISGDYRVSGYTTEDFHFNVTTPDCRQPRCQPVRFQLKATSYDWGPSIGLEARW